MSRLIEFYKTQVRILWEWRGGPVALLKRLVITFVVAVLSLIVTAGILPGVTIGRVVDAAIAVILMTPVQRAHPAGDPDARRAESPCC